MSGRVLTVFWTAVAVSVLLLGGGVATTRRILAGGPSVGDIAVLSFTLVGLAGALFVAGRIVFVTALAQRRTRSD